MFSDIRIEKRLLIGFGFVVVISAGVSMAAILNIEATHRTNMFIALALSVACSSCVAWYVTRGIVRPLRDALVFAKAIEIGNLNVELEISCNDEIGQLLTGMRQMVLKLRDVIANVKISADGVALRARELLTASEDLSLGAEKLSQQTHQIVTSMNEIQHAISDVAKSAAKTAAASDSVLEAVAIGRSAVITTADDMGAIAEVIQSTANILDELGRNSAQIGNIVNVIKDIAGQTNLLALNAAIEAARAGEHGRGFAVVADEVRGLSERTTQSTKDVSEKVLSIQTSADASVRAINRGSQEAAKGVSLAQQASNSLDTIVFASKNAEEMALSIASATEQQSASMEEMMRNLQVISKITESSVDAAQGIKHSSADLARLSNDVREMISFFKGTRAEAEALVKRAITHINQHGCEKAFADISDKNGDFVNRDLFVFIYDMQGTCLAHGRNTEKIGENMIDFKDPDGRFTVRERLDAVRASQAAWQTLRSINPATKELEKKSVYSERMKDIVISSGAYI